MGRRRVFRADSDELDNALMGYVLANRINDVVANPNTKRSREYLSLLRQQWAGEHVYDDNERYRREIKMLVPHALDAYEKRHGVRPDEGIVYFHEDPLIHIAAACDGMEGYNVGLSVHVRRSKKTWYAARDKGLTKPMYRVAQALMAISGAQHWIHLNYLENEEYRIRKLSEELVARNDNECAHLEEQMIAFLLRSRQPTEERK